jgi:hypothetical protein
MIHGNGTGGSVVVGDGAVVGAGAVVGVTAVVGGGGGGGTVVGPVVVDPGVVDDVGVVVVGATVVVVGGRVVVGATVVGATVVVGGGGAIVVVVVGVVGRTVMTLLLVNPEPSSTTSIFHVPGGAWFTLRQDSPWLSTFGMMYGPYVTSGLVSFDVTYSCDVVEFGVSPVIRTLNGGVTLGALPDPAHPVAS